jgi:hypothetical protein
MKIRVEVKTGRYRYLWLKAVVGFDARHHCAKCLAGPYEKIMPYGMIRAGEVFEGELDAAKAPYFYLCGVTSRYSENLHIAFRANDGGVIEFEDGNVCVMIEGAERVPVAPIPPAVIEREGWGKEYSTCRNFQFGWWEFGQGG